MVSPIGVSVKMLNLFSNGNKRPSLNQLRGERKGEERNNTDE